MVIYYVVRATSGTRGGPPQRISSQDQIFKMKNWRMYPLGDARYRFYTTMLSLSRSSRPRTGPLRSPGGNSRKSTKRAQTSSGRRNAAARSRQNPGLLPYLDKRVTGLSSFAARPMEQPVECELCYEMVNLRNMDEHRLTVCPGRFISCRMLGCNMVFRAWDRADHEKNFCQGVKRVERVVRKHKSVSKTIKLKRQERKEETKRLKKLEASRAKVRQKQRFVLVEQALEKRKILIADREKQERLREKKLKHREEERLQKYRNEREQIIQAGLKKLEQIECEHCGTKVAKKYMAKHLRDECPVTMIPCGNKFCSIIVQRQDWNFHTHGISRNAVALPIGL